MQKMRMQLIEIMQSRTLPCIRPYLTYDPVKYRLCCLCIVGILSAFLQGNSGKPETTSKICKKPENRERTVLVNNRSSMLANTTVLSFSSSKGMTFE